MTWTEDEKSLCKERYGCSILKVSCSPTDAEDRSLPTDAFLVEYIVDDVTHYDITRTQKESKLFDMYYDKFGKGLIKFSWTKGTIKPKLWGYQPPEKKKKR
ncbi:hypothetical protein HOU04_gp058 [Synechococcus phage S-T4]|jgi:hypothetical protein|uniref:Uncharacterized protein n=1 Tax=Synechococcus phage S-T4 TaxID=2268578 RepID=A0A385EHG2_9CAUD|nr:hypothetical protein HOU04_gp058 [Synechococcus phage S-T4]AXQ70457.1 hypothetical protein [Synechococcus phage S-T4]